MICPERSIGPEEVAAHYDRLDRVYREVWGEHLHHGLWRTGHESPERAVEQLIEFAAEPLGIEPGDRICDVGCGYGAPAAFLQKRHGIEVIGITNSVVQFEHANSRPCQGEDVEIRLRNWETNDLISASVDGLLSIECLSHVSDQPAFFREICRVLKPGGRAVILDWFAGDDPAEWQERLLLDPICRGGNLARLSDRMKMEDVAAASELGQIAFDDVSDQVNRTWRAILGRASLFGLSRPEAWSFASTYPVTSWRIALTISRLMIAYRTGSLRYGRFVFEKL